METKERKYDGKGNLIETTDFENNKTKTEVKLEILTALLQSKLVSEKTQPGWVTDSAEKMFNWIWR
jgi:hypothetical protein